VEHIDKASKQILPDPDIHSNCHQYCVMCILQRFLSISGKPSCVLMHHSSHLIILAKKITRHGQKTMYSSLNYRLIIFKIHKHNKYLTSTTYCFISLKRKCTSSMKTVVDSGLSCSVNTVPNMETS